MGWRCATGTALKLEYFECLARHQVAHVFNSWEAMPPVGAIESASVISLPGGTQPKISNDSADYLLSERM